MPRAFSYIRFSTPEQSRGDSYRRQTALSQRYAEEHGLDLDDTLTFRDEGVSAFHGKNVDAGALGDFIAAVDAGIVPSGSYLLVESLDRLSRENVRAAFLQFSSLLDKGVNIVTLSDNKVYTADAVDSNFSDLMISLSIMFRAHEESSVKSQRLKATWSRKRELAIQEGKPLTATCPAWLRMDKEAGQYELIEGRAEVVRRIFQMYLSGTGKETIAKRFNEEGLPPFGNGTGWHHSYIFKILTNPAAMGAFQPHRQKETKGKRTRVPEGDLLRDYFPAVVSEADFLKVQQISHSRALPSGPKGKRLSNLFTGLVYCGLCGATMRLVNKGKPPKGYRYYVCSNGMRGASGCRYHSWRHSYVEPFLLLAIQEIDYRELLPTVEHNTKAKLERLEEKRLIAQSKLERATQARDTILDLLVDRPDSPGLLERFDHYESEIPTLEADLQRLSGLIELEQEVHRTAKRDYKAVDEALKEWVALQRSEDDSTALDARARLASLLRRIIDRIEFTRDDTGATHGSIKIALKGVLDYHRLLVLEKGQKAGKSVKAADGVVDEDSARYMGVATRAEMKSRK